MIRKALLLSLALLNLVPALEGASDVSVLAGLSKGGKFSGTNPKVFKAKKPKATAAKGTIRNTLNLGKGVTIKTESPYTGLGDLKVGVAIGKTKGKNATLTLDAVRDIAVNAEITLSLIHI